MTQPNIIWPRRRGFKSSLAQHLVRIFSWKQTSISYLNSSIKLNFNQTANVNLKRRSDAYFKYTLFYFKVVRLFIRNLFRVRHPYSLLIRSNCKQLNISTARGSCDAVSLIAALSRSYLSWSYLFYSLLISQYNDNWLPVNQNT
jgi:hypothetical protein